MKTVLDLLEEDARLTAEQIAARLGMDPDVVREQIAAWEKEGVIRRYKAVIDRDRLGDERVVALIDVSVTPQRNAGFDEIATRIARFPEVRTVMLVSGGHDLRVVVEGQNMRDVANFVAEKLAPLEQVNATNTHFVLKRYKEDGELLVEGDENHRLVVAP